MSATVWMNPRTFATITPEQKDWCNEHGLDRSHYSIPLTARTDDQEWRAIVKELADDLVRDQRQVSARHARVPTQ